MPTLADLRRQYATDGTFSSERPWRQGGAAQALPSTVDAGTTFEEVLVSDARSELTPCQIVEGKFGTALRRDESRQALAYRRLNTR